MTWKPSLDLLVTLAAMLVGGGIAWGVLSGRVDSLNERDLIRQRAIDALYTRIDSAHLDGLSERVNGSAAAAADAKALATKLLDDRIGHCGKGE